MKLVITATSDQIDQPFNPRFGRCEYFILVDSETQAWQAFPNPAREAGGGAGPQAVQFISKLGAQTVVSGHYGPNAFSALEAAGIAAYIASDGAVSKVLEQFHAGQLEQVSAATGPEQHRRGH